MAIFTRKQSREVAREIHKQIKKGNYDYELMINDVHSTSEALTASRKIEIKDFSKELSFGRIGYCCFCVYCCRYCLS